MIRDLEDGLMDVKQSEQQKENRILKNEDNLRSLQHNIKHTNIHIAGIPEEERERYINLI